MFTLFRFVRKLIGFAVLAVVVYLAVTFVQVWMTSRRDGARPAEAIVVFGAAQYNGKPSPVLKARLDHAADLYAKDLAPVVVVTGGQQPGDTSKNTEASASADYLAGKGVPQEDILRENNARNTWDSLASAANFLKARGMGRVILVTDPFHAARVQAMAKELGLDSSVSPTRTSPIRGTEELRHFGRETVAVAAGRVFGFRRVMGVDKVAEKVRDGLQSG